MRIHSKDNITKPLVRSDGTVPSPTKHPPQFSSTTTSHVPDEPSSYTEASRFPEWRAAMNSEFQALLAMNTWSLVPNTESFHLSRVDSSLFIFKSGTDIVYLLIYVDDIVVISSTDSLATKFLSSLSSIFPIKDLGPLHYFLGIEVHRDASGFSLSQSKYILDLLTKLNLQNCKPVTTPMALNPDLNSPSPPLQDISLYRSVIGSLQYLAFTRPDIAFVVNKLCQYMHKPTLLHWRVTKCLLRYLQGTHSLQLHLASNTPIVMSAFSDSNWASDTKDRRSTASHCIYIGSSLISWSSKKQATVSRSSTEAEYRALATGTCEILWLQSLLAELGIRLNASHILWCDNLGATYLAANPVLHQKSKHMYIDLDFHFVQERIANRTLKVAFISTKDQISDALTKPLAAPRFL